MKQDCPVCNSTDTRDDFDFPESMRACDRCGSEWNCDDITLDVREYYTDDENELLDRN